MFGGVRGHGRNQRGFVVAAKPQERVALAAIVRVEVLKPARIERETQGGLQNIAYKALHNTEYTEFSYESVYECSVKCV